MSKISKQNKRKKLRTEKAEQIAQKAQQYQDYWDKNHPETQEFYNWYTTNFDTLYQQYPEEHLAVEYPGFNIVAHSKNHDIVHQVFVDRHHSGVLYTKVSKKHLTFTINMHNAVIKERLKNAEQAIIQQQNGYPRS